MTELGRVDLDSTKPEERPGNGAIFDNGLGGLRISYPGGRVVADLYAEGLSWSAFAEGMHTEMPPIPQQEEAIFWADIGVKWALERVKNCHQRHSACSRQLKALPSRILDLGRSDESEPTGDIRLLESNGKLAHYACLSHRWGQGQHLTTTTATITSRKHSIAFYDLPRTFQHAVTFTRLMGLRYIWIDSLCIIQDDDDDWRREASQMASIYHYSSICIAATSSFDGNSGLWHALQDKYPLESTLIANSAPRLFLHNPTSFMTDVQMAKDMDPATTVSSTYERHPLLGRGWVLQERLLAPRVLHFLGNQLYFECMSSSTTYGDSERSVLFKFLHTSALSSNSTSTLVQRWHQLVETYCTLDLTVEADKLPAISGIARQFVRYRREQYIAGLWEGSVIIDLMWCRRTSIAKHPLPPRPKHWRAPSWSWASLYGQIMFIGISRNRELASAHAVMHSWQCSNLGDDEMGGLSAAWIRLTGSIGAITPMEQSPSDQHTQDFKFTDNPSLKFKISLDDPDSPHDAFRAGECFYLHLGRSSDKFIGMCVTPNSDGTFTRIGLAWFYKFTFNHKYEPAQFPPDFMTRQTITIV